MRCPRGTWGRIAVLKGMDIPLLAIGALLVASLTAFFSGVLPYPIGWIILGIAFVARLLYLRGR